MLVVKHLHSAEARLTRSRLPRPARATLARLLRRAIHDAESRLRGATVPGGAVGPGGGRTCGRRRAAEDVARNKLVEELLDAVVEKGFLSLGDLRDAMSRNAIKLHDLAPGANSSAATSSCASTGGWPWSWTASTAAASSTAGCSSASAACSLPTRSGRLLTRTLLVPLGGAFLMLEGLEHTIGLLIHLIFRVHPGPGRRLPRAAP